ncbi:GM10583 [Drosophila sechellia]|uniref:GM10583 n=2 Tax=Drosophila sechellia TaxID=7238 RepID=B4I493_DROSE|nr:GM10583 [Drosophila sechellia]
MPTLSRYEQLGLSMASYSAGAAGTGGSSSTLSSAGSTVSNAMAANGSAGPGGYAAHLHHTLPHNMAPQRGHDPLNLADYLTTSSLIDYGLNKPPAAHMTLPKGMGLGLGMVVGVGAGMGVGPGPGMGMGMASAMAAGTSLSPSQLNTITHKSAAGRNHIITDTLPGPESCV